MNYEKQYVMLIELRKDRELNPDEYYEKHHIGPKSLGGPDEDWNIIPLTAREHYLAHGLLYKICEGEDKLKMSENRKLRGTFKGRKNPQTKKGKIISPQGEVFIVVDGLIDFCEENNLSLEMFRKNVNKGKISSSNPRTQKARNSIGWSIEECNQ